jgi:hypothetical protein
VAVDLIQVKVNRRTEVAYRSRKGADLEAVSHSRVFPSHLVTAETVKIACLAPLVALR